MGGADAQHRLRRLNRSWGGIHDMETQEIVGIRARKRAAFVRHSSNPEPNPCRHGETMPASRVAIILRDRASAISTVRASHAPVPPLERCGQSCSHELRVHCADPMRRNSASVENGDTEVALPESRASTSSESMTPRLVLTPLSRQIHQDSLSGVPSARLRPECVQSGSTASRGAESAVSLRYLVEDQPPSTAKI